MKPLEVACLHCKTPFLVYQKGGTGGLIKIQVHRIIESAIDFSSLPPALTCPHCQQQLGSLANYKGRPCYFLIRGQTSNRVLKPYRYPKG